MNQNDTRKLYYEAKNNKAMVAAINEMFETSRTKCKIKMEDKNGREQKRTHGNPGRDQT